MACKIIATEDGSIAEQLEIQSGDILLQINGHPINDRLDYMFFCEAEEMELLIERCGEQTIYQFEKEESEPLGLVFESFLMEPERHCKNHCIFCFIDQLPDGMRDTLYFKDDDTRLSFLQGNYVTLTNLAEEELDRIVQMKISPINLSVHATDPEKRVYMMKNPAAGKLYEHMKRFAAAGITMNCQIVLCPDVNNGEVLAQTMEDLAALYPQVNSVSIVPVGLSRHREGLCKLTPFNKERALGVIEQVEKVSSAFRAKNGVGLFYLSDEFYLLADLAIPEADYYDEYPQIENGVGLSRSLEDEFMEALDQIDVSEKTVHIGIVTGTAAAPLMKKLVDELRKKWHNLQCDIFPIVNDYFGHDINVAGLVTATDIMAQLQGRSLPCRLLIPSTMLRYEQDMFLDSITVQQVEETLGVQITPVICDGAVLLQHLIGE